MHANRADSYDQRFYRFPLCALQPRMWICAVKNLEAYFQAIPSNGFQVFDQTATCIIGK